MSPGRVAAIARRVRGGATLGALGVGWACATVAPEVGGAAGLSVVVDDVVVRRGPAAYAVRVEGRAARSVVALGGAGEIVADESGCRFARLDAGALTLWQHDGACGERRGERLCFASVQFVDDAGAVRAVVDGCAEANELFLDRIAGADGDLLGPRTLVERCADVAARDPRYVRVLAISVDDNAQPWSGVRLRHDGDAFGVCFLARPAGRYRVEVIVEDPRARTVVLEGAVEDL